MGGPEDSHALQAGRQAQKELCRAGRCHRFGELLFLCIIVCGTGLDEDAHLNALQSLSVTLPRKVRVVTYHSSPPLW